MSRPKKRRVKSGKISLVLIMFFLVIAMSVAMIMLYQKKETYAAKEVKLAAEKTEQEKRQQEIKDLEAYSKTNEYVENTAKTKLGLVYEDEIVFRER